MTPVDEIPTVGELLAAAVNARACELALIVDDERFTYRELQERSRHAAKGLIGLGARPGSTVAVLMANEPLSLFTMVGAWLIGVVVLPINARYRTSELAYVIEHADVETLLTSDMMTEHSDYATRLAKALPGLGSAPDPIALNIPTAPKLRSVVLHGSDVRPGFVTSARFDALAATVSDEQVDAMTAQVRADEPALIMYTSGTTAHPKGCVHAQLALVGNGIAMATCMRMGSDDVLWDPLPLFHIGGLIPFLGAVSRGAAFLTTKHFEAGSALASIEREPATLAYVGFQTHINSLLDHPEFSHTDLSRLRYLLAIGPEAFLNRVQKEFPAAIQISCYGCTEMGGIVTLNDIDDPPERRRKTCGPPWPGIEIRAFDPATNELCPPEVNGELRMRGYSQMLGYHKAVKTVIDEDGWFASGDRGFVTRHGEIVYTGRLKDMLKVGGENVAATEVEFYLTSHPAVSVAQVIGRPDERLDEVVVAFVELKPGHNATTEELIAFCVEGLSPFKVPREVIFVTEWPLSTTKIQKFRLAEQLSARS